MECSPIVILSPWCRSRSIRYRLPGPKIYSRPRRIPPSYFWIHHVWPLRTSISTHRRLRRCLYIFPSNVNIDGLFLTWGEFGPGDNIGLLSAKLPATCIRGQFYGIAAAVGKLGAFTGAYAFTDVFPLSPPSPLELVNTT
jgi:hypothetical protein